MRSIIIIFNLIFISLPLFTKDEVKWSTYQGKKTFQEAKEHCQNMKMRLPTISELKQAEEAGTTKNWIKNGSRFWAVNKDLSKKDSIYYNAISLKKMDNKEKEEIHRAESQLGVFCANVTEESVKKDLERLRSEEILPSLFSDYQGSMSWWKATEKCQSQNMRLPTLDELNEAYKSGITKLWKKDGYYYWSSTPYDAERYYILGVSYGSTSSDPRDSSLGVRCRR